MPTSLILHDQAPTGTCALSPTLAKRRLQVSGQPKAGFWRRHLSASLPDRPVGEEARKAHAARARNGFIDTYLSGHAILDIGYKGYLLDVVPIVPQAVGVELDYPGYDGVTLPFKDASQDAVFTSHCLEHIEDFQNAIRDWFRVLKAGGYLIIMVPHKFLYEKRTDLPSRFNADHKRFYTPASLMAEVEASLAPNTYRLRRLADNDAGYDYAIPPEHHSGGSYELELVIEKIVPPKWCLAQLPDPAAAKKTSPASEPAGEARVDGVTVPLGRGNPSIRMTKTGGEAIAVYNFGALRVVNPRILVLKLDHLGDFIIGIPGLQRLRQAFPTAHIRLVVGTWNRAQAEALRVADGVVTYDYFPQHSLGWDGKPHERIEKFRAVTAGCYDVAIDLRVDEDTRHLLREVDAETRCGIGSVSRHPFLDIALPPEHPLRDADAAAGAGMDALGTFIPSVRFKSRMPFQQTFHHGTDFRAVQGHLIYGPYMTLPLGRFTATFDLRLTGWALSLGKVRVKLDVLQDGTEVRSFKRLRAADFKAPAFEAKLEFVNESLEARYEFRVHASGKPPLARLQFGGVHLHHAGAVTPARFRRAELHIGEQISLLVQLVIDRTQALYRQAALPSGPQPCKTMQIMVAPFSNSDLRDWPTEHYARLIRLFVDRLDCTVTLLGSPGQAEQLDRLANEAGGGDRVHSLGGRTSWPDMPDLLRAADLVVCNNSGIAHLAAAAGTLTLAIYSASHQPQEWGPRGQRSHAMMAVVPCSPCGHDRLNECPNEHRCMRGLAAEAVFAEASALLLGGVDAMAPRVERIGTTP